MTAKPQTPSETSEQLPLHADHVLHQASERFKDRVRRYKPAVSESFRDLERELSKFSDLLNDDLDKSSPKGIVPKAVVFEPRYGNEADPFAFAGFDKRDHAPSLEAAVTAYQSLDLPLGGQRDSPVCLPGVIVVRDPAVIDLAREVNRLKDVFQSVIKSLPADRVSYLTKNNGVDEVSSLPLSRVILSQFGQGSLSLLSAYRQIPLIRTTDQVPFPPPPIKVHFTEARSRIVIRRTLGQLIAEAEKRGNRTLADTLRSSGIPQNEYVYKRKKAYSRIRANLTFAGSRELSSLPTHYFLHLPLLVLQRRKQDPLPQVCKPRLRADRKARKSRAFPLSKEPLGPNLKFYRRRRPEDREYA